MSNPRGEMWWSRALRETATGWFSSPAEDQQVGLRQTDLPRVIGNPPLLTGRFPAPSGTPTGGLARVSQPSPGPVHLNN
jgi:hypothetical protein